MVLAEVINLQEAMVPEHSEGYKAHLLQAERLHNGLVHLHLSLQHKEYQMDLPQALVESQVHKTLIQVMVHQLLIQT
jgi:hypothetical protein